MNSRAIRYATAALTAALLLLGGCGYAKHSDPILRTYETSNVAAMSARLHAHDIGGAVWAINCCGSMLPLIQNGDVVVTAPTPFGADLLGCVVVYRPRWAGGKTIVHRLVARDSAGFIASGDNNAVSEPQERVTAANYLGEVVAIYRTQP